MTRREKSEQLAYNMYSFPFISTSLLHFLSPPITISTDERAREAEKRRDKVRVRLVPDY